MTDGQFPAPVPYEVRPARFAGRPAVTMGWPHDRQGHRNRTGVAIVERADGFPAAATLGWPEGQGLDAMLARLNPGAFEGDRAVTRAFLALALEHPSAWTGPHPQAPGRHDMESQAQGALQALRDAGFRASAVEGLAYLLARNCHVGPGEVRACLDPGKAGDRIREFAAAWPVTAHLASVGTLAGEGKIAWQELAFGLTPAHARRLESLGKDEATCFGQNAGDWVLGVAGVLPVEWLPVPGPQAVAFGNVVNFVASLSFQAIPEMPVSRIQAMLRSSKGDWASFWERCVAGLPPEVDRKPEALAIMVADMTFSIAKTVVLPLMARAGVPVDGAGAMGDAILVTANACHGERSLPSMIRESRWWHAHIGEIGAALPSEVDDGISWPVLSGQFETRGLVVVPLSTATELAEEGAVGPDRNGVPGLDHCVSSYRREASLGLCHILSVRERLPDGGYHRLATAEVGFDPDGILALRQLKGPGNATPCERSWNAVADFIARDHPLMAPREPESGDEARLACGYDWRDDALLARAVEAHAPLLPRFIRGLDLDGVSNALGIRAPEDLLAPRDGPCPGQVTSPGA